MNPAKKTKPVVGEKRWVLFSNGCVHGVRRSELVVLHKVPRRSVHRTSVSVFTVSRTFGLLAGLAMAVLALLLFAGCQMPRAQKGGSAMTTITRAGHTNAVSLAQSENPKEPSRQRVQSEQTIEYVLPAGTALSLEDGRSELGDRAGRADSSSKLEDRGSRTPNSYLRSSPPPPTAILNQPVPVKCVTKDQTETQIGGAQKDTLREWAAKAAAMQPVLWTGIAMMTIVAGALVYFGWWTKAAVAVVIGLAMIVLAATLPEHGTIILLGGVGVFGLVALLVLYAYYKGQLDRNNNGVLDILERKPTQADEIFSPQGTH